MVWSCSASVEFLEAVIPVADAGSAGGQELPVHALLVGHPPVIHHLVPALPSSPGLQLVTDCIRLLRIECLHVLALQWAQVGLRLESPVGRLLFLDQAQLRQRRWLYGLEASFQEIHTQLFIIIHHLFPYA